MTNTKINKPWTGREQKHLVNLIERFNVEGCAMILERSVPSIMYMLGEMGLKSPHNVGKKRVLYADSVANIFELKTMGFDDEDISKCFQVTPKTIQVTIKRAERLGFEAFPTR